MKWLLVGPATPDTFAENIAFTLTAMGHEARIVAPPRWPGRLERLGPQYLELRQKASRDYVTPVERLVLAAARRWHPDVFLAPTQQVGEAVLADLRRAGVRVRIAWWADPPANMKRMGLATREWDLLLFKDPDAVRKFRAVGLNAHLLHEAMNPEWHKPIASHANDEVAVAGNWYGFRQFLVSELMRRQVAVGIYGPPPPLWAGEEIRRGHTGRYVVKLEKSRVFGEALACLNSTQFGEGNSLNCRAFEIAGTGGLQVIEWRPMIEECFDPGTELLAFASIDEILAHIDRARRAPAESARIRAAGARRALAHHTYRHRIEQIQKLSNL